MVKKKTKNNKSSFRITRLFEIIVVNVNDKIMQDLFKGICVMDKLTHCRGSTGKSQLNL